MAHPRRSAFFISEFSGLYLQRGASACLQTGLHIAVLLAQSVRLSVNSLLLCQQPGKKRLPQPALLSHSTHWCKMAHHCHLLLNAHQIPEVFLKQTTDTQGTNNRQLQKTPIIIWDRQNILSASSINSQQDSSFRRQMMQKEIHTHRILDSCWIPGNGHLIN